MGSNRIKEQGSSERGLNALNVKSLKNVFQYA